jgi:hypothetical protein
MYLSHQFIFTSTLVTYTEIYNSTLMGILVCVLRAHVLNVHGPGVPRPPTNVPIYVLSANPCAPCMLRSLMRMVG